jgi:predicted TIM-barrel fold metal-dependent hydrolase
VLDAPNVYPDLSGSGVDRGMMDSALHVLGSARLLWACDLTMETGLAKLRALEAIGLSADDLRAIRWANAARLFPNGTFPRCTAA